MPPDAAAEAPAADPVEAVEEAAHAAAENVEAVAEGLADATNDATGELPADAAATLSARVGDMEASLSALREQLARLPGMAELTEATGDLEETVSDAAEAAEEPVHVTVDAAGEVAPKRSFWPRGWPKWL